MPRRDGTWIRAWRQRNGYTQAELALELKVSRQTIVGWEHIETIDRLVELSLIALEAVPVEQTCLGRGPKRRREL